MYYLCYCFALEFLSLIRTQCIREQSVYMMKNVSAPRSSVELGVGLNDPCGCLQLRILYDSATNYQVGKTIGYRHSQGHRETKQLFGSAYRQLTTCSFHKALQRRFWGNIITSQKQWRNSSEVWLSEEQTRSYLKISRDCHRGMLKAEIDLDSEIIEMVDRVCKKVMKDFEREDRRLVFDWGYSYNVLA